MACLLYTSDKLPLDHPARAPFNLFAQSSDTVRSGIILVLGTRLQVLQNQAVQRITSRSDIDLTACLLYTSADLFQQQQGACHH